MKNLMSKLFTSLFLISLLLTSKASAYQSNKPLEEQTIKVGFYEYAPYYFINKNDEIDGYYNELLKLLAKELKFKYEYVFLDVQDSIKALKNGDIDLLFGISDTKERENDFIYTKHYVHVDNYSIYTNRHIRYGDIESLNGLRFGYIQDEANYTWIIDYLEKKDVFLKLIPGKTYADMNYLLTQGKVDAIVAPQEDVYLKDYKEIFKFSTGPVYIASGKENEKLIENINYVFEKYEENPKNPIKIMYNDYFNQYIKKTRRMFGTTVLFGFSTIILAFYITKNVIIKGLKTSKIKNSVRNNLESGRYVFHYQPIINPKNESIKGFEALLRLKKNGQILPPHCFLEEIEKSSMNKDIALWGLRKAIEDYILIKNYIRDDFYISINVSTREIESNDFIEMAKEILKEYTIPPRSICLEIIERFNITDAKKLQKSIKKLRDSGFMVAVDDFGVEYSNLDILDKIDYDIVKLDKYFIDDIENSVLRREIIEFVCKICKIKNKTIVSEGVETQGQRDIIKAMDNEKFYIQGYYYSKPLSMMKLIKYIQNKRNS